VTCIKSLDQQDDGQATGGGCHNYRTCAVVDYSYVCANGQSTKAAINHCWTRTYGECTGGGGSITTSAGGGTWNVGGGSTVGGTISKPAPKPSTIQGVTCFPKPTLKERFFEKWEALKETYKNWKQKVGCSVNTISILPLKYPAVWFLSSGGFTITSGHGSIPAIILILI
jgi:hypothetical protein